MVPFPLDFEFSELVFLRVKSLRVNMNESLFMPHLAVQLGTHSLPCWLSNTAIESKQASTPSDVESRRLGSTEGTFPGTTPQFNYPLT